MTLDQRDDVPLLPTKLVVPRGRPRSVLRDALLEQLNAATRLPLTLVAAPAGFGKTTLLAQWLATLESGTYAWVSLDAADRDVVRFWAYIVAGLQEAWPSLSLEGLDNPLASRPRLPTAIAAQLIVSLAELDRDVVLVLDDYHLAEDAALDAELAFLLDHLPSRLHVVLGTRVDPALPLSRLRGRGQLLELRAADLRCTADEASRFCSDTMGLDLTAAHVRLLETRTEGWWAGLQLAALSMRDRSDPGSFLDSFAGSHRHVLDYLVEEVLDHQPAERQTFLLRTAVLDRLSGPLCDAVTESVDSQAQLEKLERDSLFVVPLDDTREWYRYHHLFQDVLRHHLLLTFPDEVANLHVRASTWFAWHGLREEAVEHAVSGSAWDTAAELIEAWMEPLRMRGEYTTLFRWLSALPDTVRERHPLLSYQYGLALVRRARAEDADTAQRALQAAEQQAIQSRDTALLGAVERARLSLAIQRSEIDQAIEYGQRAIAAIPSHERQLRLEALATLSRAWSLRGDPLAARPLVCEAQQLVDKDTDTELRRLTLNAVAHCSLAAGELHRTYAAASEARQAIGLTHSPEVAHASIRLSEVLREWNRLDEAEAMLEEASGMAALVGQGAYQFPFGVANVQLRLARGDLPGAEAAIQQVTELVSAWDNRVVRRGLAADRAWVDLLRGDLVAVRRWAASAEAEDTTALRYLADDRVAEMLLRAWLALGAHDRVGAVVDARRGGALAAGRVWHVIALDILHALALQAHSLQRQALGVLTSALESAAPENYVRTFVREGAGVEALLRDALVHRIHTDYTAELLSAFGTPSSGTPQTASVLTAREREVLGLLARGHSNRELAEELVISPETVKVHVARILHKLEARNRAQALVRARELDLL